MLIFGVLAYLLGRAKIPFVPMMLAFVLTPMLEMYMRQSFDMGNGDISIFFRSPISITIAIFIVIFCSAPAMINKLKKKNEIEGDVIDAG